MTTPTHLDLIVLANKCHLTSRTNFFHNEIFTFYLPVFFLIVKMNNNELQFTFAILPESKK